MTNPLKAAAMAQEGIWPKNAIVAYVRGAVGCETCGGKGRRLSSNLNQIPPYDPCPAEHVELVVLGETIWADPSKCREVCTKPEHRGSPRGERRGSVLSSCIGAFYFGHYGGCVFAWQPRWELLAGTNRVLTETDLVDGDK